ncbi:MAG TPA: thiamine-phosphate kinase [Pseudonocardiaceae bacterium]|nr:thiamine-phosphate kinase [Pseudonocardiaceae bacterium]
MSHSHDALGDLGERKILTDVLQPRYRDTVGFGDDCAVLGTPGSGGELVATTDTCPTPLLSLLGHRDMFDTGWLLATINLSDLAAAGAVPFGLVTNYTLPRSTPVAEFERMLDGVDACAAAHGTNVVGGDLRDGETTQLSATAIGQCAPGRRLGRSGAAAGDRLLLVGSPGYLWAAALVAGHQATLPAADAAVVLDRARRPMAQLAAGRLLAESGLAHAAMDVSDGLFATVRTLCETNAVGARMVTDVRLDPVLASVCDQSGVSRFDLAATWGDWCLLVAVGAADVTAVTAKLATESIPARVVGTLFDGEGIALDGGGPWHGVAQERFSPRSWHGADLDRWMADLLGAASLA